jgi:hypothetical protein
MDQATIQLWLLLPLLLRKCQTQMMAGLLLLLYQPPVLDLR